MTTVKKIGNKLKSRSGESIAEVLIAVLVAAVGLVLLAGMIGSTTHLVKESEDLIGDYVDADRALVERSGESGLSGNVVIKSGVREVKLSDDALSASIPVVYYKNSGITTRDIISYKVK